MFCNAAPSAVSIATPYLLSTLISCATEPFIPLILPDLPALITSFTEEDPQAVSRSVKSCCFVLVHEFLYLCQNIQNSALSSFKTFFSKSFV